jgi:hypothetical protein
MSNKFEFGSCPLDEVDDDAIEQAIQNLIVDSGRRRWGERTCSYQIVWVAREFADPDRLRKDPALPLRASPQLRAFSLIAVASPRRLRSVGFSPRCAKLSLHPIEGR